MKHKLILWLALALNCGWFGCSRSEESVSAAGQGQPASLRVVVIPSKAEVRIGESFRLALRVENPSLTNQTVRVWNCSWDDDWQCSNPKILFQRWGCTKNFLVNVEISPGGAYTHQLRVIIEDANPDKELAFRMGFASIGSKKTYWSKEIKLRILSPNK